MLRIRWVDDMRLIEVWWPPIDDDFGHIRGLYDPEWNEIILVRWNIHSVKALVHTLFHEFLHALVYRLKLPRKLNQVIDKIDRKWQMWRQRE